MKIKEFEPKDYSEVRTLWSATGISLGASDEYEEIIKFHKHNSDCFLVGWDEITDSVIAVCMGGFDGRRGYIHHLAVKPEFQKQGYGLEILSEVIKMLKRKGALKVHLFIESRNSKVVSFYEKVEWTRRNDIIVMSKTL